MLLLFSNCAVQGHRMRLECSYGTVYDNKSDVEEIKLQVDSVCMIPPNSSDSDSLYVQEATEIPEVSLAFGKQEK